MSFFSTLLSITLAVAGSFSWIGFLCRLRGGRYRVERDEHRVRIETHLTNVTFHRERQELRLVGPKDLKRRFDLADVLDVAIDRDARSSAFELIDDFGITDLFERYQDKRHTWTIYIKMRTGEQIPVAVLRQFEVRDFLDFATPIMLAILKGVGLYHEGPAVSAQIRNRMTEALRWSRKSTV